MIESNTKKTDSVICIIAVVGFHHERGNELEWYYPTEEFELTDKIKSDLTYLATPDRAHEDPKGYCYFRTENYFGVSCFQQIPAHEVKDQKDQITRSMVQKSVVVIAKRPLFGAIRCILDPCTQAYFNEGYFDRHEILEGAFLQLQAKFNNVSDKILLEARDSLFLGISLQKLIKKYGRNALILYKLMWLEKRIVFYGYPAADICDSIVALSSLMPHYLFSLSPHAVRNEKELKESVNFSLPLQIFDQTFMAPSISLVSIEMLNEMKSFIVGSTNRLFAEGAVKTDVIVFNEGPTIFKWLDPKLENILKLPQRDKMFIDAVIAKVKECELKGNELYEGSDVWIRTKFNQYTLSLLSVMVHSNFGAEAPISCVYNQNWVTAWTNTVNFQKWKETVNCAEVILHTRPVHIEHDTKTELDELQEIVSARATTVSNYLWSIYESSTTTNNPVDPNTAPSEEKAPNEESNQSPSASTLINSFLNWSGGKESPQKSTSDQPTTQEQQNEDHKPDQPPPQPTTPPSEPSTTTATGNQTTQSNLTLREKLSSYINAVPSTETVTNLFESFWKK